ncbi:Glycosyl transferase family 2 [Pigmentiphaga humi]|uniref:Glycosyl transferase family 2 n=1 Tax=Pigmentiphaga humi TaxID=2478468 RepID=A0A3P4B302_9BURK|nr:glycosyltransferase family 2 protein [Pigmentiphaga humi]VCU70442.1 Glycosyl transferase family 2 [Pigmentiphaga humi]
MIGVCIPAHNEEEDIGRCLAAMARAVRHPGLRGEPVEVVVVLDACSDRTAARTRAWPVTAIETACRNVGLARAAGARRLLDAGARWLAFTDADTVVSESWLADQLSLQAAVVCGTVEVGDWTAHGPYAELARNAFLCAYQDRDGHRHVHGANLGIDAAAYRRIGGFQALACSEDQALVDKLERAGVPIAWTALPRVVTSARPFSRVAGGFACTLRRAWEQQSPRPQAMLEPGEA